MGLRVRLALISSLVTLLALVALAVFSGFALERIRLRDIDEELVVQARVVMDEAKTGGSELSSEVSDALVTPTGSSVAWVYLNGGLVLGAGAQDGPEPLDAAFLLRQSNASRCNCDDWRVYSLRQDNLTVQVGRPLEPVRKVAETYWRTAIAGALIAALFAGIILTYAVARITRPLERLACRITDLENDEPIPALGRHDEIGAVARALQGSLNTLKTAREREARFLADAAHELRTPVTALMADLDHHTSKPRSSQEDLSVIERAKRSARHLRELAGNLLTLSHAERTGSATLKLSIDLLALAGDVADRLAPLAASKGLELFTDGEPVSVHGDRMALEQAISNLISNAINFSDTGEISVRVSLRDSMRNSMRERQAVLEITDPGIGMEAAVLERVFEPFERGGETRREGSGLGLAVVKAVIEAHGGNVWLESEVGHGTKATILLPRA